VPRGKFVALSIYITIATPPKKHPREITNNLMMYLKLLENHEQVNPQTSKWKETIKIKAEIFINFINFQNFKFSLINGD
jgi:hypothetical protein